MTTTMGQTIKRLRKERNFTQEELAEQLNVTSQAVSKWENETGMPDISQIVPLASVFGVSADVLFGIEGTTADDEAWKIIEKALSVEEFGKLETYLTAYDMLTEGLKKYPNNLMLLNSCMGLGLSLSLPENGWIYDSEHAPGIANETIRQANLIISYSKNIADIMRAHQVLVFIYSSEGLFDKAVSEAQEFPPRSDFTYYSNMARIYECMKDDESVISFLCSDIDYSLQYLEDNIARLGKAYFNSGKFGDAISVYENFFSIIKSIFKDDYFPSYHDFDSGDCYILLAQAYLAVGETDKAMNSVENSVNYYLNLHETYKDEKITHQMLMKSPLVKETQLMVFVNKLSLKERLLAKLSAPEIKSLYENERFKALYERVNSLI
jgi:Predicted transcriptional regulators